MGRPFCPSLSNLSSVLLSNLASYTCLVLIKQESCEATDNLADLAHPKEEGLMRQTFKIVCPAWSKQFKGETTALNVVPTVFSTSSFSSPSRAPIKGPSQPLPLQTHLFPWERDCSPTPAGCCHRQRLICWGQTHLFPSVSLLWAQTFNRFPICNKSPTLPQAASLSCSLHVTRKKK